MLLVSTGFKDDEVWDMPMDRFTLYTKAARRVIGVRRSGEIQDMAVAIGSALGGKDAAKEVEEYVKGLVE